MGPEHLEDPTVLPELQRSGFIQIPEDCLIIRDVLGAVLQETVDGFTPLTKQENLNISFFICKQPRQF